MRNTLIEMDAEGNLMWSCCSFATARDFARFGMFYLNNGKWMGKQLLPLDWINHAKIATKESQGQYGAHFWLGGNHGEKSKWKQLPNDTLISWGFQEQYIVIIPSYDLVIVRLGWSKHEGAFNLEKFVLDILKTINKT